MLSKNLDWIVFFY